MRLLSQPNILCLFLCQALFIITISVDLTYTGLAGYQLAAVKDLATLPYSLITLATAITTLLAAAIMRFFGRKRAFLTGAFFAVISGFTTFTAIRHNSFILFSIGTAFVGVFQAFSQYYRLAAADFVRNEEKHKAISTILLAGVIGVLIGPSLFNRFISNSNLYSIGNAYLTTMLMGLLVFLIILCLYHETSEKQNINPVKIPKRPFIFQAIKQPIYVAAVSVNAISYAVMMFAMTATPIAMMKTHHDIHYSTSVIQLHMIAMFATSFITGKLISRWGKSNVIFIGIFFNVLCALIMIFLQSVLAFFIALLFLGIGWNLMFISGSALLARSYDSDQKYAMQSIAEFITFTFSGIGALSAGWVLNTYSWTTINLCILPLLAIPVITTLYYRHQKHYEKI